MVRGSYCGSRICFQRGRACAAKLLMNGCVANERSDANLACGDNDFEVCDTSHVEGAEALPHSLRILLENVLRNVDDADARELYASVLLTPARRAFRAAKLNTCLLAFCCKISPVCRCSLTAVMREAARDLGADPARINPQIPLDLVIDHSVIADAACCADALEKNMDMEFKRNGERYRFLKWAQSSFQNVRIVPPRIGHLPPDQRRAFCARRYDEGDRRRRACVL